MLVLVAVAKKFPQEPNLEEIIRNVLLKDHSHEFTRPANGIHSIEVESQKECFGESLKIIL